jgi:hypothetical protein
MMNANRMEQQVHDAVSSLLGEHDADLAAHASERLVFSGQPPAFDSVHKLTASAAAAVGSYALAVETLWAMAKGRRQTVDIDWVQAASSLNPGHFQKQSGKSLPALSLLTELKADFYRTRDDRWFFPIGSYPHLRDGVLELLYCANTPTALAAAIGRWCADDLEYAFAQKKLPGAYARTRDQWLAHPQGAWLNSVPVIQIEKIADSPVEPPRCERRPLDHLRVLDLGHVIAGPVVARSLAEHGAQVLRLDPPMKQDPFRQTIDTNIGKRSAFIDLDDSADVIRCCELAAGADVVVQSWRHGSMHRRGLGPQQAAEMRPGVVYVSVSAYGDQGPWAERGGFEQLGQVVSGIALSEGSSERPRLVPTYLLNDYLTGYLGVMFQ